MRHTVAELFCGCGGFSRGFSMTNKFRTVLGNDVKKEALKTFAFNNRHQDLAPASILGDIRTVPLQRIRKELEKVEVQHGTLDCLIGGPPCQGFSQLRRTEERTEGKIVKFRGYDKLAHDPRNDLVLRFLEVAEYLEPKFAVIENVPQMLSHGYGGRLGRLSETVIDILEEMGYSVEVSVITAADYGVPQLRERALFIASAAGPASFPKPTHVDPSRKALQREGLLPWVNVQEAIGDLPAPSHAREELGGQSVSLYRKHESPYAIGLQSKSEFPYNHISRAYSSSVLSIIKHMRPGEEWDSAMERMQSVYEKKIARYAKEKNITREDAKAALIHQRLISNAFYKRYYWSAYTRLSWESPALTITANANFLGSGRFTHPEELRGITMREAARLQSFDDDFRFITSAADEQETSRIGIGMDMIGEAVPPLMAKAIAQHLAAELEEANDGTNSNQVAN